MGFTIYIDKKFIEERDARKKELLAIVEAKTPVEIKEQPFPIDEDKGFTFMLDKEKIERMKLWDWYANYRKEAVISTAGIRGAQNILYPWDYRFPINTIGVTLATLGKSLVAKSKAKGEIRKIAASEVRYNSKTYVKIIARIQAAQGIRTIVPDSFRTMPIWMLSFLIYKLDLAGGEHVTSSHAVSTKSATKDLNFEGSQYLPEESIEFVDRIEEVLKSAEKSPYPIRFSAIDDPLIDYKTVVDLDYGTGLYVEYLKNGVATDETLELIRRARANVVIDCVGGSMYPTLSKVFTKLGIEENMRWLHIDEDPFFWNIGKLDHNPKTGIKEYHDISCDASLLSVVKTAGYEDKLKAEPIGTVVEITDPDGDRLVIGQIEASKRKNRLDELGIASIPLGSGRILSVYSPNQAYLMTMDYYSKQLKEAGLWDAHPRFMIKTTPSALSWEEWAEKNGVHVVNVPVGFKEIASIMKKVERQIRDGKDVAVKSVYGDMVRIGKEPRLIFAGEESGGMITGPEQLIESSKGRRIIAMREKSACEAMVIITALASECKEAGIPLSEYLARLFDEWDIVARYDIRKDITYYNESEQDPIKLKEAKLAGEALRDKSDIFFLGIVIAVREGKIGLEDAKRILSDAIPELDFSNLVKVIFVGDGSYFRFTDKYVEIRKSGTDAKTRVYASGDSLETCRMFSEGFGNYDGTITPLYRSMIDEKYLSIVQEKAISIYLEFLRDGT
jgi:phosphomannomutase